jgi:hypothetical protein
MKLTKEQINEAIADGIEALSNNPKKKVAFVYPDGFVPNSYQWPAPAQRVIVRVIARLGKTPLCRSFLDSYDRKRSYGRGSYITLWNK